MTDLEYLRKCLEEIVFTPYPWEGEDKNLGAFRSKEELIEWYCQQPGVKGQPYRDRGFYTRELAMISRLIQPKVIVELGTSLGIGTCLLHWLNPEAELITVDSANETFLPGDRRVEVGHLAKHQRIPCEYVKSLSWEYERQGVNLCFIDADHTYNSVIKDSNQAIQNLDEERPWAIVWHDYQVPGVAQAIRDFCDTNEFYLKCRSDSDTVWITSKRM